MFKSHGILGQNARNLDYIKGYNTKFARRLADSKLKTKDFLQSKRVAVPKTLSVIKNHDQINIEEVAAWDPPFVIKPNNGYGGKGIIVIDELDSAGNFVSNTGQAYSPAKIVSHLSYVIDGFFSLSGLRDKAMIEKKIVLDEEIDLLGKYGLPDVRIICFNNVPIMAMIRIPTEKSEGKANVHLGACAAGIDIGTGKLTYITQNSKIIKAVPGIGDVRGIKVPKWEAILTLAVKVQYVTGIGYLGCDIVLDKDDGPLLLEMNVRAGLEVQVANMAPLKQRLDRVEGVNINSPAKGVRLGRDLFSGDIEEKIKNISGKKVLGAKEYVALEYNEKTYKYIAEIQISHNANYIDYNFAKDVLKINKQDLDNKVKIKGILLGESKNLKFKVKDLGDTKMVLGSSSLRGFLVDPFKYRKGELPVSDDNEALKGKNTAIHKRYGDQLEKLDTQLMDLDKKLVILSKITPNNIESERKKFVESQGEYVPQFEYNEMRGDLGELLAVLEKIEIPDIPLSNIFDRKKSEIESKIKFLMACNSQDTKSMGLYSAKLYGEVDEDNLKHCGRIIASKENELKVEEEFLSVDEIKDMVNKFNHIYGIKIKLQIGDRAARFVMKGDTLLVRPDARVEKKEMRSIIAHEIEGHYLRKVNGQKMDHTIFKRGTAGYIEIDEGIAIYNQNRFLTNKDRKYYGVFEKYYLIHYATNHGYESLIEKLLDMSNHDYNIAFRSLVRLKRGVVDVKSNYIFTKDLVYVNGYMKVDNYINTGGDLKELYLGKMTAQDLQDLKDSYFLKLDFSGLKVPFFL